MNDERRDELLLEIHSMLGKMKVKLDADYKALHGNGSPGLIDRHAELKQSLTRLEESQNPSNHELNEQHNQLVNRVERLEQIHKSEDKKNNVWITWIALAFNAVGTIYAIMKHH